jgi:hypothetical protein
VSKRTRGEGIADGDLDLHPDSERFEEEAFEDWDFRLLFDPSVDGIQDIPDPQGNMDLEHLRFDRWFVPFTARAVHPYAQDH